MPKKPRQKHCEAIYHIMCHSIPEILLFRDNDDKDYYLRLIKRYTDENQCSVYAYCLMDNHVHIHLDPRGYDISKFMRSLNTAYVSYYNKRHKRRGHLFQDRFESRILNTDQYNLAVSAYIHKNAKAIQGYLGKEEAYKYSSYGIYLGITRDEYKLVDMSFIMGLFNITDYKIFTEKYFDFVSNKSDDSSIKELQKNLAAAPEYVYLSGRKIILRDKPPSEIISHIYDRLFNLGQETKNVKESIAVNTNKAIYKCRAISAYALRVLCGLGYKEICNHLYNITISGCSRLCSKGYELIIGNDIYKDIWNELVCY
ncbi:MAG TPA: transposase [Clostridiales bacterium]|nr:transposase [Clostridiales bacterium]